MFWTVALSVMAFVSIGEVGVQVRPEIVRSGFGAGTPKIWNSAICPPGAPVFDVMRNCTLLAVALTGIVTVFCEAGLNVYDAAETRLAKVEELWSWDSTWIVCVRVAQMLAGFSLSTIEERVAFAPRSTVIVPGSPLLSQ